MFIRYLSFGIILTEGYNNDHTIKTVIFRITYKLSIKSILSANYFNHGLQFFLFYHLPAL